MTYDAVFYTRDNKARALELVRRLPPAELQRRRQQFGLTFKFDLPVPNADGTPSGECGTFVFTTLYGAVDSTPAQMAGLTFEVVAPGLVGANWRPEYFTTPEKIKQIAEEKRGELATIRRQNVRVCMENLAAIGQAIVARAAEGGMDFDPWGADFWVQTVLAELPKRPVDTETDDPEQDALVARAQVVPPPIERVARAPRKARR